MPQCAAPPAQLRAGAVRQAERPPYRAQHHRDLQQFAASLPTIRRLSDADIDAALTHDLGSVDEVLLGSASPVAILRHRIAHQLYTLGAPLIARLRARSAYAVTGVYIHPGAEIGPYFSIEHGNGTWIAAATKIGAHVHLHQNVTLGAPSLEQPALIEGIQRPGPVIDDHVEIHAGATIEAGIRVGRGSMIGPNVSVTADIPPETVVAQGTGFRSRDRPLSSPERVSARDRN